jgi:Rrf2 family protein
MSHVLKISEAGSLALHTMVLLACQSEKTLSSHEIASFIGCSEAHLSKVMQRLAKTGLVTSRRGPRGGFSLKKRPEDTSLLEVFEAIEGPLASTKCLLGRPVCNGNCILGELTRSMDEQARQYFAKKRLSAFTGAFDPNSGGEARA